MHDRRIGFMLTKKDLSVNETKNAKNGKNIVHKTKPTEQSTSKTKIQSNFSKTRITVKFDVGYPNQLFIRGTGGPLSWEKGLPLKNVKSNEWIWETDVHFQRCEFKILINDQKYEIGENHILNYGSNFDLTPKF